MAKRIELDFDGYYLEDDLPPEDHQCSGIYMVYSGNDEYLKKLLYIGRSSNIAERPSTEHHKYNSWRRKLQHGEYLHFYFADTNSEKRAEAALIYHQEPPCNEQNTETFGYSETTIVLTGRNAGLLECFTVEPTG